MMDKKVALVTGASRGIGKATAIKLAQENIHVVALARTVGALEELDDEIASKGGSCTLIPQDLKKTDKLENLGPALAEKLGRLDIFIANAGLLGTLGPLAHASPKEVEMLFKVNVLANQALIRTLDPLLRQSDAGRVVTLLTSPGAMKGRAYWGVYGATKVALDSFTNAYADEVKQTNIKVMGYNPGAVRTKMRAQAVPGEDPKTLPPPEETANEIFKLLDL